MFGVLMRRSLGALRQMYMPRPDPVVGEIDAAIEAIEQALIQIRRDYGVAEVELKCGHGGTTNLSGPGVVTI